VILIDMKVTGHGRSKRSFGTKANLTPYVSVSVSVGRATIRSWDNTRKLGRQSGQSDNLNPGIHITVLTD
jgi:hypothetical protein